MKLSSGGAGTRPRYSMLTVCMARPAGFEPATDGLEVVARPLIVIALTCFGLPIHLEAVHRRCPLLTACGRPIGHATGTARLRAALLRCRPRIDFFRVGLAARRTGVALGEKVTVEDLVEEVALAHPEPARGSVGSLHDEVNAARLVPVPPCPEYDAVGDNWHESPPRSGRRQDSTAHFMIDSGCRCSSSSRTDRGCSPTSAEDSGKAPDQPIRYSWSSVACRWFLARVVPWLCRSILRLGSAPRTTGGRSPNLRPLDPQQGQSQVVTSTCARTAWLGVVALIGLGGVPAVRIARSSPRFLPSEGRTYLSGHPVAQASPGRAAPACSRWRAALDAVVAWINC
jgi:hypothetical protein